MAGAGKSTIGITLAKHLGFDFIDSDHFIENEYGQSLQQLLDDKGKEEFLKIEEKALMSIDFNKTVLATGGSAIFSELAMNYIREKSSVIFIDVTFNQLRNRISDLSKRGFLKKPNQTFRDAFTEREFFYKKYSDYEVQNNSTIEKCMDNIFLIINQKP